MLTLRILIIGLCFGVISAGTISRVVKAGGWPPPPGINLSQTCPECPDEDDRYGVRHYDYLRSDRAPTYTVDEYFLDYNKETVDDSHLSLRIESTTLKVIGLSAYYYKKRLYGYICTCVKPDELDVAAINCRYIFEFLDVEGGGKFTIRSTPCRSRGLTPPAWLWKDKDRPMPTVFKGIMIAVPVK